MYFGGTGDIAAHADLSRILFPIIFAHYWLDAFSGG
jgi:hypothetical protein